MSISVILSVFNRQSLIGEPLDSLLRQTDPTKEKMPYWTRYVEEFLLATKGIEQQ